MRSAGEGKPNCRKLPVLIVDRSQPRRHFQQCALARLRFPQPGRRCLRRRGLVGQVTVRPGGYRMKVASATGCPPLLGPEARGTGSASGLAVFSVRSRTIVEPHRCHNFTTTDCIMAPHLVTAAVTENGGMMKITDPKSRRLKPPSLQAIPSTSLTLTTSQWVMGRSS